MCGPVEWSEPSHVLLIEWHDCVHGDLSVYSRRLHSFISAHAGVSYEMYLSRIFLWLLNELIADELSAMLVSGHVRLCLICAHIFFSCFHNMLTLYLWPPTLSSAAVRCRVAPRCMLCSKLMPIVSCCPLHSHHHTLTGNKIQYKICMLTQLCQKDADDDQVEVPMLWIVMTYSPSTILSAWALPCPQFVSLMAWSVAVLRPWSHCH